MWVLVIVLLAPLPGAGLAYRLNWTNYATIYECQVVRNQVGFDMAEAYPHERDFVIECRPLFTKEQTTSGPSHSSGDPLTLGSGQSTPPLAGVWGE